MPKILFVCQANVGRSQMAEAFYNFMTESSDALSAGAEDFRQKYNFRPTPDIVAVMQEKGIDISAQRMKVLTPEMSAQVGKIVVLCNRQFCPSWLQGQKHVVYQEISDPFGQGIQSVRAI